MKQYLTATIQAISKSELDALVEPAMIKRIKEIDPAPEIRVYSIGHEGKTNLHLPGVGNKTFTWIQAAVQWIADKLNLGTAVFDRHDPNTNSHEGRTQIGQVVGKTVKTIGDRLNTLAAIYIYPQFKSRPLDVASIEAEIEYTHDANEAWITRIQNVSGVALGSSGIDNPGFPGATLLGAVQAYVQAFEGEFGGKKMNLSEVKQAVKELGLAPAQIFDVGDIMADPKVVEKVKEEKKDVFNMSERIRQERDEAKDKLVKLENAKAESDKRLQQVQMQSKGSTIIDSVLTERKLDAKESAFVKRNMKNFTTTATDEDGLKVELNKFVDGASKEYKELAKDVFGVDNNALDIDKSKFNIPDDAFIKPNQNQGGQPPKVVQSRPEVLREEMNPALNPLIPGGKAAQEALKT